MAESRPYLEACRSVFSGLTSSGRHKTITTHATRGDARQERLERFVRQSPWEYEAVEEQLRQTAPDDIQGPDAALIVDGMGIPKKGDHSGRLSAVVRGDWQTRQLPGDG